MLESVSQPRELTVQASVDEQTADLGDESAQELAVGDLFEHHLLAAEDAPETTGWSTRPCAATSARKSRASVDTSSRAAISPAAARLTEDAIHGRAKKARSSASRPNSSPMVARSRAIAST